MIRPLLAGILAAFLACAGGTRASETFVTGPGDRLSITVHRRADLSGEFRVLPGGALSLPFVGNLPVAGRSVDQIREALTQRLREDASLLDPRVSVEIAEMQPVLVTGAVRRPGQYPFQLGMTVGHALAAAGGMRRFELEEVGARVEIIRLRERLRQGQDSFGISLVRQARLVAETADAEDFAAPAATARYLPEDRLRQTVGSEREILRRRGVAHTSVIAMLATQTTAYNDEIRALADQDANKARESELLTQEGRYLDNLMRQGLSPRTNRVIELARFAVQVEGERRQIQAFMARARQEIARLEQTRINAITSRHLEIATALKEVEDSMTTLRVGIEETRTGLTQLRETLPADDVPVGARTANAITILRVRMAPTQRLEAQADTELMPGDLVDVALDDATVGRHLASGLPR
jgi:exopolysaccharide production protein ExoF